MRTEAQQAAVDGVASSCLGHERQLRGLLAHQARGRRQVREGDDLYQRRHAAATALPSGYTHWRHRTPGTATAARPPARSRPTAFRPTSRPSRRAADAGSVPGVPAGRPWCRRRRFQAAVANGKCSHHIMTGESAARHAHFSHAPASAAAVCSSWRWARLVGYGRRGAGAALGVPRAARPRRPPPRGASTAHEATMETRRRAKVGCSTCPTRRVGRGLRHRRPSLDGRPGDAICLKSCCVRGQRLHQPRHGRRAGCGSGSTCGGGATSSGNRRPTRTLLSQRVGQRRDEIFGVGSVPPAWVDQNYPAPPRERPASSPPATSATRRWAQRRCGSSWSPGKRAQGLDVEHQWFVRPLQIILNEGRGLRLPVR